MKYRKGIKISEATEKELLRYQMEKIAKESCSEDLSGESTALAELYKSLKNSDIRVFIGFLISLHLIVDLIILVKKLFRGEV